MSDVSPDSPWLGRYRLRSRLTRGGMAELFLAVQAGPAGYEKEVVIKRVLPYLARDERFVSMFLDEARLAARLSHPNIVQVLDFGEVEGTYFLCLERLVGLDLAAILRASRQKARPVPAPVAATILSAACEALHYAHTLADAEGRGYGIIHRDVSPSNVFVTSHGAVKVLDFGIAKAHLQSSQTEPGQLKGKFKYMSPEQLLGEPLDARSDVFSLGVVLYELLTGARPLDRTDLPRAILDAEEARPLAEPLPPEIPPLLADPLRRALHPQREERLQSASELRQALDAYLATCEPLPPSLRLQAFMRENTDAPAPAAPTVATAPSTLSLEPELEAPAAPPEPTASLRPVSPPEAWVPEEARPSRLGWRWVPGGIALLVLVAAGLLWRLVDGRQASPATVEATVSRPAPVSPPSPAPTATAPTANPVPVAQVIPRPAPAIPPARAGDGAAHRETGHAQRKPATEPNPSRRPQAPAPPHARPTPPTAPGLVSIGCEPQACHISVDGEDLHRDTPVFQLALPPGPHVIKGETVDSGEARAQRIDVTSRAAAKVLFHF